MALRVLIYGIVSCIMQSSSGIAKKIARWVALGALFLIPLTPLLIANSYFFPFITGKTFYFRILVEIVVAAWIVLALLDKEYRPRFSLIGAAVVCFVAWMFVADLFAINVAKAFWSNFERMEGWVLLIHLLGFFLASSAVLRVEKKWRAWFLASIAVSIVVSGYAFLQLAGNIPINQGSTRIDATLGNSAYLAIYFLFNVFIALWLAFTEKYSWLKWSLVSLAAVEVVLIFYTETRGTVVGLTLAFGLAMFLTALTASKRVRRIAVFALIGLVLLVGGFYLARHTHFVESNHTLQRIDSISLAAGQTRFTIWHMAFEGFLERPIVGWGQEGFNYVFNKFYDPSLYMQEQWFDRAHNAFIDWLVAGGAPAFLLYLSLFGSALFLLWKNSELSRPERIIFTAALTGYAVHNFFVFDNLYSYVYFFAILAFIDSQVARPIKKLEHAPVLSAADGVTYALPIAAVVAIALIWTVNIPGMEAASELIVAISPTALDPTTQTPEFSAQNIATFEDLVKHPAFAAQEIREQLVSTAATIAQSSWATEAQKQQIVSLAISEMGKQVAAYPLDARERLELSYAYHAAGDNADALKQIEAAIALSPAKEEFWIEAGITEWDLGNVKAAQSDFDTAYALGPEFQGLAKYAAAGDIAAGNMTIADHVLIGAYGTTTIDSNILMDAYYRAKNWQGLIDILKLRTSEPGADVTAWFNLAAGYYTAGDKTNAIATIKEAVKLFAGVPGVASSGAAAIAQIKGNTVGQ